MTHETAFVPPHGSKGVPAGRTDLAGFAADLERLFQAVPTPILLVDQESLAIAAINQAATRALGHSATDLLHASLASVAAPGDRDALSTMPGVLQARSSWGLLGRDGKRRRLEVAPATLAFGGRSCALLFLPPETEASAQQVTDAGAAKPDFSFAALHDLKEPLHLVKGYLALLREHAASGLDAQGRDYLETAFAGTQRLQATVQGLLEYFRADAKGISPEPVDLGAAVRDALAGLRLQVAEAAAHVTQSELPVVLADRVHVARLLENLLSNALKFRAEAVRPEIHVGATRTGRDWEIWVQDNGIGIAAPDQQRVLQPFQRVHSTDRYPGTGLGLSICKKIVELHGGRLWIESAPGRGTTVHFTLPGVEA